MGAARGVRSWRDWMSGFIEARNRVVSQSECRGTVSGESMVCLLGLAALMDEFKASLPGGNVVIGVRGVGGCRESLLGRFGGARETGVCGRLRALKEVRNRCMFVADGSRGTSGRFNCSSLNSDAGLEAL